jgi:polyisoprenoid-binding protein YceI
MKTRNGLKTTGWAALLLTVSGGWAAAQSAPGAAWQAEQGFAGLQGLDFSRLRAGAAAAAIEAPPAPTHAPAGVPEEANYTVDAKDSSVKFTIVTAVADFSGNFKNFTADARVDAQDLTASKITVVIDMMSSSANSFLISDKFLHKELEADRFATSTLKVVAISATDAKDVYEIQGDLDFEGESSHEIFKVELHRLDDGSMRLVGKFQKTVKGHLGRVFFDVVLRKADAGLRKA